MTNGYHRAIRQQAIRLYLEGNNLRRIGCILSVNHQSVANWINAYHAHLPTSAEPVVATPETVELDEVFTFIGSKKASIHCDHCRSRLALHHRA
jgi:transposase-like protein